MHMRQRLKLLDEGLGALDKALAAASPAFALSAGPDGKLVVTGELCAGGQLECIPKQAEVVLRVTSIGPKVSLSVRVLPM